MLTWLLFYTSIFQARKTPMVDVVDPAGVVRSQVVENDSGSLRITLNGAENQRTIAGHFIAESFGSAVQHIALRTSDMFATAAALKANGFKPLAITAELLRRPRGALRPRSVLPQDAACRKHPLRPRRPRRVLAALQPQLRRRVLLRDRRAAGRLCRLRRAQRDLPDRRPAAVHAAERNAEAVSRDHAEDRGRAHDCKRSRK